MYPTVPKQPDSTSNGVTPTAPSERERGDVSEMVTVLDSVEKRVEAFREMASQLETEKEHLVGMLDDFASHTHFLHLSDDDRSDITATTSRLLARTKHVEVAVTIPRNDDQKKALASAEEMLSEMTSGLKISMESARERCLRMLNACATEQPDGPVDHTFQGHLIGCTADDQKRIRKKLTQMVFQIEKTQSVFMSRF